MMPQFLIFLKNLLHLSGLSILMKAYSKTIQSKYFISTK